MKKYKLRKDYTAKDGKKVRKGTVLEEYHLKPNGHVIYLDPNNIVFGMNEVENDREHFKKIV